MSIFSALRSADRTLQSAGVAIRTVGQNIANAGNEDYSRQRVLLASRPPAPAATTPLGTGVEVKRIERVVNDRVEEALPGL